MFGRFPQRIPKEITPEFVRSEVARGPGDHSGEHQSSGDRADDHRAEFSGEDQREHRQQRGGVEHRGGSGEDALGDEMGRGHGDGSVHGQKHPRDARMDFAQFAGADRHGADLSGAGKSRRQGGGTDVGNLSRHADRAMRAGRGLFHDSCGRVAAVHSDDGAADDGHCFARRQHHGEVVPGASQGEFSLHALGRDLRNHGGV